MQEILEMKDQIKLLKANIADEDRELSAETVAWKKFVATFYIDTVGLILNEMTRNKFVCLRF